MRHIVGNRIPKSGDTGSWGFQDEIENATENPCFCIKS